MQQLTSALGDIDLNEAEDEVFEQTDYVELILAKIDTCSGAVSTPGVTREFVNTRFLKDGTPVSTFMHTIEDPRVKGLLPSKAMMVPRDQSVLLTFYYNKSLPPAARALGKSQPRILVIEQKHDEVLRYDKTLRVFIDNQAYWPGQCVNIVVFGEDQLGAIVIPDKVEEPVAVDVPKLDPGVFRPKTTDEQPAAGEVWVDYSDDQNNAFVDASIYGGSYGFQVGEHEHIAKMMWVKGYRPDQYQYVRMDDAKGVHVLRLL